MWTVWLKYRRALDRLKYFDYSYSQLRKIVDTLYFSAMMNENPALRNFWLRERAFANRVCLLKEREVQEI